METKQSQSFWKITSAQERHTIEDSTVHTHLWIFKHPRVQLRNINVSDVGN